MVCAITGASGYVGSILASALSGEFEIVPVVRRETSGRYIPWDMTNPRDISRDLRDLRVTTLIHAAWDFTHPDAKQNERCNVAGSQRLFESAQQAGIERILFISTISAFSGARSAYGQSKLQVEQMVLGKKGIVIRPGLVWGPQPGGMFGALSKQVESGSIVPLIGSGRYPQYLVHQSDLADAVLGAAKGDWHSELPVTVANERPWMLRDLISSIASEKNKRIKFLPTPWRVIYLALKAAETAGLKPAFRSDSVLSLIYQNARPDFAPANRLGLNCRAYDGTSLI